MALSREARARWAVSIFGPGEEAEALDTDPMTKKGREESNAIKAGHGLSPSKSKGYQWGSNLARGNYEEAVMPRRL